MNGKLVVAVIAGVIALTWFMTRPDRIRYKMTVEVETPEGVRRGFAVREVAIRHPLPLPALGESRVSASVRGEAVVIDLPDGRVLFALLSGEKGDFDYGAWIADWALNQELFPGGANAGYKAGEFAELYPTHPQTQSPIVHSALPMLVRFRDIRDPKSVEKVSPEAAGVKRIWVETTSDAVTTRIEKRLGWLKDEGLTLDPGGGPTINPTFAQTIRQREFSTEIGK